MVTPSNSDGFHPGVYGGVQIHGRVADDCAILWSDSQRFGDFQRPGGIGFVGEVFVVS